MPRKPKQEKRTISVPVNGHAIQVILFPPEGRRKSWYAYWPGLKAAYIHTFRKTSLQYARSGEDVNQRVAADARVGAGVLMRSYAKETDEEMRQRSNRTFARIAASLPPTVADRYGYKALPTDPLAIRLEEAVAAGNWDLVARLSAELAKRDQQAG